jgi:hypothetical protein
MDAASPLPTSLMKGVLTVPSTDPSDDAKYLQTHFAGNIHFHTVNQNGVDGEDYFSVMMAGDDGGRPVVVVLIRVVRHSLPMLPSIWITETDNDGSLTGSEASSGGDSVTVQAASSIREIRLPGGATILKVPSTLLALVNTRSVLLTHIMSVASSSSSNGSLTNGASCQRDEANATKDEIVADPLPTFPSLSAKLLDTDRRLRPLPLNAREPIVFKTDLFHGKILMIIRPQNPAVEDPYWNERIFATKKRRLVIQIQGKFQRQPQGVVYAGAEVSEPMKLGLLTRGLCKVLLRVVESFNKNMHYSFGDAESLSEHAHIVAPAYTLFERLVVTPPGETPPHIDETFEESPESISQRKRTASVGKWNTTDTYSFSFYSMYIDLPTWKLFGLPASGDLNLESFWGQSLLRICMYEKTGSSIQHLHVENRYAFSVQVKFLGKHGSDDIDDDYSSDEEDRNVIFWSERPLPSLVLRKVSQGDADLSESQHFLDLSTNNSDEELGFFDAVESHLENENHTPSPLSSPLYMKVSATSLPNEMLAVIDTTCPFSVDVFSGNRNGGYAKAFAVNIGSGTVVLSERACEELVNSSVVSSEIRTVVKTDFSPRLSSSEQFRRLLVLALSRESVERITALRDHPAQYTSEFLRRPPPSPSKGLISGFVARALSDRHWVEEYVYVTNRCIAFRRPDKRQVEFMLPLSSVSKVGLLSPSLRPQQVGYYFLVLTTLGRSVYLMFASEVDATTWLQVIDKYRTEGQYETESVSSIESSALRLVEIDCFTDEFLHKSTMWNCKNRKILNCGKFCFHRGEGATSPLFLAERALEAALTLDGLDNAEQRRLFLDYAAELKLASVHDLDESARLAFFLNVYHTMICHAFLVLGPPDSSLQWVSYFNNAAYQVGDDIFSLSELEHCIIRAKMSFPSQFLSRFVIPKSTYATALSVVDSRINFALNCGSLSNPSKILIFRPEQINAQLDEASRLYLANVTYRRTLSGDLELNLPRMCRWFLDDFGSTREELLHSIERLLPDDVRKQLADCKLPQEGKFDMSTCVIRFNSFNFECRSLSL